MSVGKPFYNKPRVVCVGVDIVAMGTSAEVAVFKAPFDCKVIKLSVIANAAITGADTHYFTLGFKNKANVGVGTATMGSKAYTSGINAIAYDTEVISDSVNLANGTLAKDDVVTFHKTETGSGLATPSLLAVIEYVRK